MITTTHAYARAGLIGNPSDGYFGKTIAIIVKNFRAEVTLEESPQLVIVPQKSDLVRFDSMAELAADIREHGYYGGMRLLKAAALRFWDYCQTQGLALQPRNFTLCYQTNIPRLVGLAGSSAIVIAAMRAFMQFYGVNIPEPLLPNIILAAEREELGISAGLQDRVIQVYEGVMFMDFDRSLIQRQGHGHYERLDPRPLPPIYLAYDTRQAEGSEVTHNNLRARFDAGDPQIVGAMQEFAGLAAQARRLLLEGQGPALKPLMNRSFDLRRTICQISDANLRMIEAARRVGASSQFAGSGGAIIGIYDDERMYRALERELKALGCVVCKPQIN